MGNSLYRFYMSPKCARFEVLFNPYGLADEIYRSLSAALRPRYRYRAMFG